MNFYKLLSTFVDHFCPPGSGSGSADPIEYGSNPDPDPQPWLYLEDTVQDGHGVGVGTALLIRHNVIQPNLNIQCTISNRYFTAKEENKSKLYEVHLYSCLTFLFFRKRIFIFILFVWTGTFLLHFSGQSQYALSCTLLTRTSHSLNKISTFFRYPLIWDVIG